MRAHKVPGSGRVANEQCMRVCLWMCMRAHKVPGSGRADPERANVRGDDDLLLLAADRSAF